jgi:hypothetical protein
MSEARYMKDYWSSKVKGNLDRILLDLKKGTRGEDFDEDLLLVSNEIRKELKLLPEIKFENSEYLTPEKITPEIVKSALAYVESVRKFNIRKSNDANNVKDVLITRMESENKEAYQKLRNDNFNISLDEFVTSKNETQKIVEYKGELMQALDPIYKDPEHKFIKAHFYAPTKQVFGYYIDTYIINVMVIWAMTSVLYLLLYFRVLKRTLSSGENLIKRRSKNSDAEII